MNSHEVKAVSFSQGGSGGRWTALIALGLLLLAASAPAQNILNLNFSGSAKPVKTGLAAVGNTTNDVWNLLSVATNVAQYYNSTPVITWGATTNLVWDASNACPAEVVITNLVYLQEYSSESDAMLKTWLNNYYILVEEEDPCTLEWITFYGDPEVWIKSLPTNTYDLYIYGFGDDYSHYGGYRYKVGSGSWSSWKYTTWEYEDPRESWIENRHYVLFTNVVVNAGEAIVIDIAVNDYDEYLINGIQLVGPATDPPLPEVSFSPTSGTAVPVSVELSVSGHGGATIYYTTNGTTPTTGSSVYGSAISLTTATTVKAFATESGYSDSAVSSATYPLPQLPDVEFSPVSGAFLPTNVVLSVSGYTNATIYYTTDGMTPTTGSPVYSTPIVLNDSGWSWSAEQVPAMTSWTEPAGNLVTNSTVASSSAYYGWKAFDENASTFWRANTAASEWLSFQFPSTRIISKYRVQARDGAVDAPRDWTFEGWNGSSYDTLDTRADQTNWYAGEIREFVCTDNGAYTKYRLNVSAGNAAGDNGSALITVGELGMYEARTTLTAFAIQTNCLDSGVTSADYHARAGDIPQIAPLASISPVSGDYANPISVSITSSLAGATYYWSTNGSDWDTYSGPITDSLHPTVMAYTSKSGYLDGSIVTNSYTFTVALTEFDPEPENFSGSVEVTLTNETVGASLFWATNGGSLTAYTAPLTFTNTTLLTAVATNLYFFSSTNSGTYTLTGVNDPPVITAPTNGLTLLEDWPNMIALVSIDDPDAGTNEVELSLSVTNGLLTFETTNGLTILAGTNGFTTNLVARGTLEDLNDALYLMVFLPDTNYFGPDTLTVVVDDLGYYGSGGALRTTNAIPVTIENNNDLPVFTLSGNVSVAEDFAGTQTVTVTPSTPPANEADQTVTYLLGSTVTFANLSINATNGTVSITALANGFGTNEVTVLADDGFNYASQSFTLEVSSVNDAPLVEGPALKSGDANTLFENWQIAVADFDAEENVLQMTVHATNGVPTLNPTTELTFLSGVNGESTTLVVEGIQYYLDLAVAGLTYLPDTNYFGDAQLTVSVDDRGYAGSGSGFETTLDIDVLIYATNAAPNPDVSVPGGTYQTNQSVTLSSALAGATYLYSFDSGQTWETYSGALEIDGHATLLAKTTKYAYHDSGIVTNVYTLQVPDCQVTPNGGVLTGETSVSITNALAGTTIYYSLDLGQTWQAYTNAFDLDGIGDGTGFVYTYATKTNCDSALALSDLFVFTLPEPAFSHATGAYTNEITVTLTNANTEAALEYSLDGNTWSAYSTGLVFRGDATLRARASKAGYLSRGEVDFDAYDGFSRFQGLNGWSFLYTTNTQGTTFFPLSGYSESGLAWEVHSGTPPSVGPLLLIPGDTNDAVRVFTAPFDGDLELLSSVLNNYGGTGDGVRVRVLTNDTAIVDWTTVTNTSLPTTISTNFPVVAGDQVRFQVNQNSTSTNDLTQWSPLLRYHLSRAYTFTDTDGDGLSDLEEDDEGTLANDGDSDGDGVSDWLEIRQGRDPNIAGTQPDTSNLIQLIVLTPLENLD